mmetsp:Transcript_81839/g.240244  ORF Transcript_81839/g.240244 Transcript_81839/m.240244 type:complete len:89 (+) Transcript_81839:284-550(+)
MSMLASLFRPESTFVTEELFVSTVASRTQHPDEATSAMWKAGFCRSWRRHSIDTSSWIWNPLQFGPRKRLAEVVPQPHVRAVIRRCAF